MIVIDASVAFKWLKSENEPNHKEAVLILQEHLSAANKIIVPDILFVEIANSLVTKTETSVKTVREDLRYLYKVNLEVKHSEESDITSAAKLAKKYSTSVYDMLYAMLAKKYKSILVTADKKFINATQFPFVKLLSEFDIA